MLLEHEQQLTCTSCSPKINHNLLSRSEVVALVNTLHRFTESLVAVNDFRKMWAREEHSRRGILLEGVEDKAGAASVRISLPFSRLVMLTLVTRKQPRQSPHAGAGALQRTVIEDVQRWIRACKEGTVFCVRGLLAGLRNAVEAVSRLFQLSGKDRAPHSEF